MRTVAVTPVIGEFGYITFDIQPCVRAWLRNQVAERKVVFASPSLAPFFEEATEIIDLPPELLPTAPATMRSIAREYWKPQDPERLKVDRLVNWARSTIEADEWLEIPYFSNTLWTAPATFVTLEGRSSIPDYPYIVVAARDRAFDSFRNWPKDRWDTLIQLVREDWQIEVHCIGKPPATYYPEGAIPQKVDDRSRLDHSIALLNGAICSISSNSGPTHLSLMAGCPTFAWGDPYLKHFMEIRTNPLKTPCRLETVDWSPSVDQIWSSLQEFKRDLESQGLWKSRTRCTVSMCMIARNSSKTLRAALESVKPWVDEMIVVDTGSTDYTKEIAAEVGAVVKEFPWCDSFAAARNESLKYARGRWILWMDSDDTISCQNGQRFQKLLGTHIPPSVMGMVMQVHCPTEEKGTIVSVDHIKVFRNVPALRFTGRIHEQVLGSIRRLGGEVWRTELFVSHSGSDLSAPGRILKQERDFRLLKLELNDEPDSTFALFNLGMTLIDMGRAEEALNPLARSLQMAGPAESHVRKAYALLVQAYGDLNRTESALWTCQRGLELFPDDPELIFRHGVLLQKVGRLTESLISFERVLALPQQNHFSSLDIGILGVKAWQNVAMISESLGHQKKAEEAWRRAIMCDPQSVVSWWGFLGLGEFAVDEGLENCLARLGTNSPDEMEVHLLVRAMTDIRRNQHRSALQLLDSHVRSPTCGLRFVEVACRLAFHSPQLTTAHEWLAILNAKQPENPSTLHNLAAVQLKLGLFGEACRNAMKSCELRPNYQPTLALLKASKAHS